MESLLNFIILLCLATSNNAFGLNVGTQRAAVELNSNAGISIGATGSANENAGISTNSNTGGSVSGNANASGNIGVQKKMGLGVGMGASLGAGLGAGLGLASNVMNSGASALGSAAGALGWHGESKSHQVYHLTYLFEFSYQS